MFKLFYEFEFEMGQEPEPITFIGTLLFRAKQLNERGGLVTEEELNNISDQLRYKLSLSEEATLERIAEAVYRTVKPLFSSLYGLRICMKEYQFKQVEFTEGLDGFDAIEEATEFVC